MVTLSQRALPIALLAGVLLLPSAMPAAAKDCGGAISCECGDRVVAPVTLTTDLANCASDGLILAAGTLDCAGHQIAGSGDRTGTVGVLVRGFTGAGAQLAEVRNCRIRNFGHGVEIDSGFGNLLSNNALFSNNIGVWLGDGTSGNRIEDNHVRDNRDEGIHVGGSVTATLIARNQLINNRRENLYLINTSGNLVEGNTIDDSGTAAILLKHAIDNVFASNTILQRNILVRGDSSGNRFEGNEVVSGYFHFEAIEEGSTWTYPHDNHVLDGIVRKASTCFEFSGAYGNSVSGTTIDTCQIKQEKERGGLEPFDNAVEVVKMDLGEHTSPGRRRTGSLRMARAGTHADRFVLDLRSIVPETPIDPLHEDVHCQLGDWEGIIIDVFVPAGMLSPRGPGARLVDRSGAYGGLRRLDIRQVDNGVWRLKMAGRTNVAAADFPVMTLTCRIGDDVLTYNDFWKQTPRGWSLRLR